MPVNSPDKEIALDHIDKLYRTMEHIWEHAARLLLLEILLSILIIGLSVGIVSVEDQLEVAGLRLIIPVRLLLGGGAFIIGILFMGFYTLDSHSNRLGLEIIRLYKVLGYEPQSLNDTATNAFDSPHILGSTINVSLSKKKPHFKFARWFDSITSAIGILALVIFLPLAAEISAGLRVASSFGWSWWSWPPFVLLVFATISSFITYLAREASHEN